MSDGVERQELFWKGWRGYRLCRIPGLCVAPDGTVLAYCEARRDRGNDWDDSDVLLRRSTDDGRTWGEATALVRGADYGHGPVNNPVCIADSVTGAVHLLYGHNYARVFHCQSHDGGLTWSSPREITAALAALRAVYDWGVVAVGPGHGIQLANGRLLAPIWASLSHTRAHQPSRTGALYSDDHGATWLAGALAPDAIPCCNEAEAVQLADGRVLLNMRNHDIGQRRAVALSSDGGEHWMAPQLAHDLYEPCCFAGLVRYGLPTEGRRGRLLFVNPDSRAVAEGLGARCNLTVRLSYDEGDTWPVARALEPGPAGYADLAVAAAGAVLCLYEGGPAEGQGYAIPALTLARFELAWLEGATCR